jgi:hypothetical protein
MVPTWPHSSQLRCTTDLALGTIKACEVNFPKFITHCPISSPKTLLALFTDILDGMSLVQQHIRTAFRELGQGVTVTALQNQLGDAARLNEHNRRCLQFLADILLSHSTREFFGYALFTLRS